MTYTTSLKDVISNDLEWPWNT